MRDEITYPFPYFNGEAIEVWGWCGEVISSHTLLGVWLLIHDIITAVGFQTEVIYILSKTYVNPYIHVNGNHDFSTWLYSTHRAKTGCDGSG